MNKDHSEISEKQQISTNAVEQEVTMKPLGVTILDFFSVVARRKRFIIWFVLIITFVTAVITILSPKWYKATASVFPAEQADLFPGLEGVSSLVKSFSGSKKFASLTGPSEVDRYIAILNNLILLQKKADLTVWMQSNLPPLGIKSAWIFINSKINFI